MNKNISSLHLDILDNDRQKLLSKLLLFAANFVLGGGTALALYLAHRKSFDFDFFSPKPLPKNLLEKLSQEIQIGNIANDTENELTFLNEDEIKITFLYYPFKPQFSLFDAGENLKLFDIRDIATQKAYAIGRRGEYRDYFDLYTIFKNKYIELPELIVNAKKTYGSIFEEKIFLQQLVYFDDLLRIKIIPVSNEPLPTKNEIKSFFEELVEAYTK